MGCCSQVIETRAVFIPSHSTNLGENQSNGTKGSPKLFLLPYPACCCGQCNDHFDNCLDTFISLPLESTFVFLFVCFNFFGENWWVVRNIGLVYLKSKSHVCQGSWMFCCGCEIHFGETDASFQGLLRHWVVKITVSKLSEYANVQVLFSLFIETWDFLDSVCYSSTFPFSSMCSSLGKMNLSERCKKLSKSLVVECSLFLPPAWMGWIPLLWSGWHRAWQDGVQVMAAATWCS